MAKTFYLFLLLLFLSGTSFSQNKFSGLDFTQVDDFARSVSCEDNDLLALTKTLTAPYTKEVYKVRAIFIWLADNIQYDYKFFNSGKEIEGPSCEDVLDCSVITKEWETKYLKKVLKQRKGICDGYSRLFKRMCEIAGIESEMVNGYARTEPYQIGSSFHVNHSWNAVRLDSAWHFLDVTWAAGYCTKFPESDVLNGYVKDYNEYYWLIPPEKLNRNHYPEKGRWAYQNNFTRDKFVNNPYYAGHVLDKIKLIQPATGFIEICIGDTIHFKFTYDEDIDKLQINSNTYTNPPFYYRERISKGKYRWLADTSAIKKQRYIEPVRKGNLYEFDYPVTLESLYYLDLLFDYNRAMRFRIRVKTD